MSSQITIGPDSWPGFQGLYYHFAQLSGPLPIYFYIINDIIYESENLSSERQPDFQQIHNFPPFNISTNGSKILAVVMGYNIMLYQQLPNGQFVELLPRSGEYGQFEDADILLVPLPNGRPMRNRFPILPLSEIDASIRNDLFNNNPSNLDEVLIILNSRSLNAQPQPQPQPQLQLQLQPQSNISEPSMTQNTNQLFEQSYEILIKQLYALPVQLPEYLIVNGLRVNFISFEQIAQMLSQNQIFRFVLDPILQPWVGPPNSPNRILTMFGKNGITYLVKARYDQATNQIYLPI